MSDKNTSTTLPVNKAPRLLDRVCRVALFKVLERLEHGHFVIIDGSEHHEFGDSQSDLKAQMNIFDPRAYAAFSLGGSIGAGESYFNGYWETDNLTNIIRIFAANTDVLDQLDHVLAVLQKPFNWILAKRRENSVRKARENIMAHYDLGNELYKLFLDDTMMYSSGFYEHDDSTLKAASVKKLDMICQRLELKATDRVIEIGTGWGGFAIHAAENYGCHVTTTTISEEQFVFARERIKEKGLEDKITLLKEDYRKLSGKFDKLVSIEMIEAVGLKYYDTYFKKCESLLKPQGKMLIQAITIADKRFDKAARNLDFIQKYIFPGGALPSIEYLAKTVRTAGNLQIRDLQDFGFHYARTLRDWRHQFLNSKPKLMSLNFDETFIRLWEFYLCYCEGAFIERNISVVHLVMDNHQPQYANASVRA